MKEFYLSNQLQCWTKQLDFILSRFQTEIGPKGRDVALVGLKDLLSEMESVPSTLLHDPGLELTVLYNLLSIEIYSVDTVGMIDLVLLSLSRILRRLVPGSKLVNPDTTVQQLTSLLQTLSQLDALTEMEGDTLTILKDLLSLIIFKHHRQLGTQTSLAILSILGKNIASANTPPRTVHKTINILDPTDKYFHRSDYTLHQLLSPAIKILVNRDLESVEEELDILRRGHAGHGVVEPYCLFLMCCLNQRRGDRKELNASLEVSIVNEINQPPTLTAKALLMKGRLLVEEGKAQSAVAVYGRVLQLFPCLLEGLLGLAHCFSQLNNLRFELDTWSVIVQTLESSRAKSKTSEDCMDFSWLFVSTLYPSPRVSLTEGKLTLARKLYKLQEFSDSEKIYLDCLDLLKECDLSNLPFSTSEVELEAATTLLINKKPEEVLSLLGDSDANTSIFSRKRKLSEDGREFLASFLKGKAHNLLGNYASSIDEFEKAISQLSDSRVLPIPAAKRSQPVAGHCQVPGSSPSPLITSYIRARLYYELGLAHRAAGNTDNCRTAFSKAVSLCPLPEYCQSYYYPDACPERPEQEAVAALAAITIRNYVILAAITIRNYPGSYHH